jgi:hypothetical protein
MRRLPLLVGLLVVVSTFAHAIVLPSCPTWDCPKGDPTCVPHVKGVSHSNMYSSTEVLSPCCLTPRDRAIHEFRDADGNLLVLTWDDATAALKVVTADGTCSAPTTTLPPTTTLAPTTTTTVEVTTTTELPTTTTTTIP